jgi:hypothetical protein
VFLSTEDPATVTYFTNASRGWSTSYVDMPRKPDRCAVCAGAVSDCCMHSNRARKQWRPWMFESVGEVSAVWWSPALHDPCKADVLQLMKALPLT